MMIDFIPPNTPIAPHQRLHYYVESEIEAPQFAFMQKKWHKKTTRMLNEDQKETFHIVRKGQLFIESLYSMFFIS